MTTKVLKRTLLFVLSFVTFSVTSLAQSVGSLRINEVLMANENSLTDSYGERHPWIEIYNNSAASVNIAACYLTTDISNPKMYQIPQGYTQTMMAPRQCVLLWIDGESIKGPFHTNFEFDPTQPNFIALYDSDGVTLIDSVTIPAQLPADQSYARVVDGLSPWNVTPAATPLAYNDARAETSNVAFFKDHDSYGVVVTIISMAVVFISLIILYLTFKAIGKAAVKMVKNKSVESGVTREEADATIDLPGDVYVAIALALYEHATSIHDEESSIITINRVRRRYSPWSSKIHTLRELPARAIKKKTLVK